MWYSFSLYVVGLVVFWYAIIFLISKLSGWNAIAEYFPSSSIGQTPISSKKFQSIKIGMSNYSGVVYFHIFPEGLNMKVITLFKPGHNPILIPWRELVVEENQGYLKNMYRFSFQSLAKKSFFTPRTLGEWIVEHKKKHSS
ncbi:MAG: hypothetical protein WCW16_04730 [Candidatus Magasanikbacteria bacterium]